jgi:hypothetical protein
MKTLDTPLTPDFWRSLRKDMLKLRGAAEEFELARELMEFNAQVVETLGDENDIDRANEMATEIGVAVMFTGKEN